MRPSSVKQRNDTRDRKHTVLTNRRVSRDREKYVHRLDSHRQFCHHMSFDKILALLILDTQLQLLSAQLRYDDPQPLAQTSTPAADLQLKRPETTGGH